MDEEYLEIDEEEMEYILYKALGTIRGQLLKVVVKAKKSISVQEIAEIIQIDAETIISSADFFAKIGFFEKTSSGYMITSDPRKLEAATIRISIGNDGAATRRLQVILGSLLGLKIRM
jgi:predicted transcriptional regulator of viral defense system